MRGGDSGSVAAAAITTAQAAEAADPTTAVGTMTTAATTIPGLTAGMKPATTMAGMAKSTSIPATGDKVEINGSSIEVGHADGTKEEIENGRFEMKDANGRTIVERPATEADRARLEGLAG